MNEKNIISNWNWKELSNDEFEMNRKEMTYYRIFHKDDNIEITDYKFWAKDEDEALKILNKFKAEHNGEYFYSTSGYFVDSNNKRYDSMKDMHNAWKNEPYDEDDRRYDIEKLKDFQKIDSFATDRIDILDKAKAILSAFLIKIEQYKENAKELNEKIEKSDLNHIAEEDIDNLVMQTMKLNDQYYDIRDLEYLLKTKHNRNESWNIDRHILEDLKFNLKKMLDNEMLGYPSFCSLRAAEILGVEVNKDTGDAKDENRSKELDEKAIEIWKQDLQDLQNHVLSYLYFIDYGIVDEDDEDLIDFDKLHSNEIPRKEGTDNAIDYKKNYEICQIHWNAIFDWLKEKGQCLWT